MTTILKTQYHKSVSHFKYIVYLTLPLSLCANFSCANQPTFFELDLSGEWHLMHGNGLQYASYEIDDSSWPKILLPSRQLMPSQLKRKSEGSMKIDFSAKSGFVWYRRNFVLHEIPREKLLFQVGEIMNADIVYLNGFRIGSSGRFPPEFKSAWGQFRSYEIQPSLLKKGKNVISMCVYFDSEAWIMPPIRIVDYNTGIKEKMLADIFRIHGIQAMSISLVGIFAFFFYLYMRRTKEIYYLYFSLCCISLSITMALCFVENLYPDIRISSNTLLKITQPPLVFFPPLLAIFYRSYCAFPVSPMRFVLYFLPPFIISAMIIAAPTRYYILFFRNAFLLTIPLYMTDLFYISIRQLIRRNKRGLLMFFALIPIVLLGSIDILAFTAGLVNTSMALYLYGIPAMLFIFALYLVNRFVTSLNQTEKLNVALRESIMENMRLAALERELELARNIQLSTLSRAIPSSPFFDIAVKYVPAEKIGGDYYSFHMPAPDQIGVLISDVSGHGVPAALIASMLNVLSEMFSYLADRPDLLLSELNRNMMGNIENQFITTAYGFIDYKNKTLLYARAGHLPLLIIRRERNYLEEFLPRGRAIGLSKENEYHVNSINISRGDRIIFYTDCAIEAFNQEKLLFGEERFKELLLRESAKSPQSLSEYICRELHKWAGGSLEDDLTLIIIDIQ
ncbi:MAG: SpoIIE family protein phosphatase [Spirochaetes bacterium]|nr:SpoIIE family protein phosphatase [Spirochaetota bacterium]